MHQQIAWFVLISPWLASFLFIGSLFVKEKEFKYKILGFISIILSILYSIPILYTICILIFAIIKLTIEIITNPYGSFLLILFIFLILLHFVALHKKSSSLITMLYTSLGIILWATANKLLKFIGISIDFTEFIRVLPIYLLSKTPFSISLSDVLLILIIAICIIIGFFYIPRTGKNIILPISLLISVYYYLIICIFTINFISTTYFSQIIYFSVIKYLFSFAKFYISSNLPNKLPSFKTNKGPVIIIGKKIYLLNCAQKVLIQEKFKKILCKSINQVEKEDLSTFSSFYITLANLSLSDSYLSSIGKDIMEDFISIIDLSSIPIFSIAIECSYPRDYLNYWNPRPLSHKEEIKLLNDIKIYCTKN